MKVSALRNGKMVIKVSDVKDVAGEGIRISEEFYYELDREVHEMIESAQDEPRRTAEGLSSPTIFEQQNVLPVST